MNIETPARSRIKKVAMLSMALFLFTTCVWAEQTKKGLEESSPFDSERLRDPFWPVGYYPEGWQSGIVEDENEKGIGAASDWEAPTKKLIVSGTSRMDGQGVAIINGKLIATGETVEVFHNGRTYQWKLVRVKPNGKVDLERLAVKSGSIGF